MRRRQFVTSATATVAAASTAGCSGILGGDGGGSSGPEKAVETYINAGATGNTGDLEAVVHPDAAMSVTSQAQSLQMGEVSVDSTEVTDQSDGQATVEADITFSITMNGEEQSETSAVSFDVRQHEGEWKIYAVQSA